MERVPLVGTKRFRLKKGERHVMLRMKEGRELTFKNEKRGKNA